MYLIKLQHDVGQTNLIYKVKIFLILYFTNKQEFKNT